MENVADIFAAAGDFKPSPYLMVSKCLTVRGWSCGSAVDCEETLDFAQQKGVECMISPFKFEQAQEAFGKSLILSFHFLPVGKKEVLTLVRSYEGW